MSVTKDDNASDKTLNNDLLTNISTHMARHGLSPGAYFYVADAAFVTKILSYEYLLSATIVEAPEKVAPLRPETGCFVPGEGGSVKA